jgi:hypothetical protein
MRRFGFLLAVITAAGCADDAPADACPAELDALHFIAPASATELIPGNGPVLITWAPPVDFAADLALRSTDTDDVVVPVNLSAGEQSIDGADVAPDVYGLALRYQCGELRNSALGSSVQRIYRQGATMSPDILAWGAETPAEERAFEIRTVSLSTMELELLAGTTVLVRESIPGELVAMNRSFAFTGVDVDDAPLPGGMYALTLRVHARNGITYDRPGPSFFWAP